MILRYNGPESPATLADLDDALERWSRSTEPDREEPEHVITALGAVLGAHLSDMCDLDWSMVSDEFGVDIAVVGQPGDIVIAPMSVTAKRVDQGITRFFEDFGEAVRVRIAEIRGV